MGRIVANFFTTLDGVVESPHEWHMPYFTEEMGRIVDAGATADAFLMGHQLYREWSQYWPAMGQEDFGAIINPMRKYVVSHTDFDAEWENTSVITGDVAAAVRDLKAQTSGNIAISGSATLVRWLLEQGLLDELQLLVDPIAVGHGARLFQDTTTHPLTLVSSRALEGGVLHLVYAPAAPAS